MTKLAQGLATFHVQITSVARPAGAAIQAKDPECCASQQQLSAFDDVLLD